MNRRGIQLQKAEELITSASISNVSAEQQLNGEWACFIKFYNNATGEFEEVYIERQREGMRTWADPRRMFDFMYAKFGITEGVFKIFEKKGGV